MGQIRLVTTTTEYDIPMVEGETVLDAMRRSGLPVLSSLILNGSAEFISLADTLANGEQAHVYALRNSNYGDLVPRYLLVDSDGPAVTEIIRPGETPQELALVKYSRAQAADYVYDGVRRHLDQYFSSALEDETIQVALSSGGDGRILAESLARYADDTGRGFQCVITPNGAEDEREHVDNAVRIAESFGLTYETFDSVSAAGLIGLDTDLTALTTEYRELFPLDEVEVLGTYFVQEVNVAVAKQSGRRAVAFGFNQEDVVADLLYQAIGGTLLPVFPRHIGDLTILAPLQSVPKKMLDSMDVTNSLRNYRGRVHSVSQLRSALYFVAHFIGERFPAVADLISNPTPPRQADRALDAWLAAHSAT